MNLDNIKIVDSIPQDVFAIRNVQEITWIDTYPNLELGITKEDVESEFSKDYKLKWLGKSKFLVKPSQTRGLPKARFCGLLGE